VPAPFFMPAAVELRGITKRFPGVVANDDVDFEASAGEVHALLGENGAGKSTLSNILTGLYRPDEGEIAIEGKAVSFSSPRDALDAGICTRGTSSGASRSSASATASPSIRVRASGSSRSASSSASRS
jgi:ABC-type branched-subunit amino acid transport system ATPase component